MSTSVPSHKASGKAYVHKLRLTIPERAQAPYTQLHKATL